MTLQSARSLEDKLNSVGLDVSDVDEETYDLFSRALPQSNLGMIDAKSSNLEIEVAGTTGAALWKISPCIAEWLADQSNVLWSHGILHADAVLVELGCGIAGLIGCALAKHISSCIMTDQRSVLKLLQENIATNLPIMTNQPKVKGRTAKKQSMLSEVKHNVHAVELNWETDDASVLDGVLRTQQNIDLIVVCDCVFNDFLIQPLVDMCEKLCSRPQSCKPVVLIAQQLRSNEVFSAFMETLAGKFCIWRFTDSSLPLTLQNGSGFAVHCAVLR